MRCGSGRDRPRPIAGRQLDAALGVGHHLDCRSRQAKATTPPTRPVPREGDHSASVSSKAWSHGLCHRSTEEVALKIGMNLLLWTAHVDETHSPLLAQLAKTGFDGVE